LGQLSDLCHEVADPNCVETSTGRERGGELKMLSGKVFCLGITGLGEGITTEKIPARTLQGWVLLGGCTCYSAAAGRDVSSKEGSVGLAKAQQSEGKSAKIK